MTLLPTTDRNYWSTWTATLLFFIAFYTLLVPLPLYLTQAGLPDWQVGLVMGAFGVASLMGRPLAGIAADSFGFRPVLLLGAISLALGAAGVPFTTWPPLLFGLRILQAVGYVAFTTGGTALAAALAPPAKRGAMMAVFGIAANVAITIVPATVSAGLDWLTIPGALFMCGGLAVVAGIIAWPAAGSRRRTAAIPQRRDLYRIPPTLRLPMLVAFLFGISFGAFYQFLPLLAERRGLEPLGLAYAVYGISIILTRIATNRLLDVGDRTRALIPAFVALSIGLVGLTFSTTLWMLLLSAALMAVPSGILHPALIALCVDRMPDGAQGRATAGFYLGFDLGIGGGAWLLAPFFENFGLTGLFGVAALVALLAIGPTRYLKGFVQNG